MKEGLKCTIKDDLELLEHILKGKEQISNLDKKTKNRLKAICISQISRLEQKLDNLDNEIIKLKKM